MATVRLTRDQCREDALPMVCAKCGGRATTHVTRTFTWCPWWVWLLLVPLVVPGLILMLTMGQRFTAAVPFCARDARHWATPAVLGYLGIPLCFGLVILAATLPLPDRSTAVNVSMMTLAVFTVVVGLVHGKLIRPDRIAGDEIVLSNVSPEFAAAAETTRPAPPRAYGDFDDEPRRNRYDVDVGEE